MKSKKIITKNIITKSKLPDADFVLNPYVGCQHGCIYCYADFMRRFTGHSDEEWGKFVDVKINAASSIKGQNYIGKKLLLGSVTDPYQPSEAKHKVTRQILEKLLEKQPDVDILTKSKLILRDIDLMRKFENLSVGISLNSMDSKVSRALEPYASNPGARISALKELSENNIKTYLFISPIFPLITDFKIIVAKAKPYIHKILFENLNIRQNNKNKVNRFIHEHYPLLKEFYKDLNIKSTYWNQLKNEIEHYCESNGIDYKIYFAHSSERKK